MFCLFFKCEVLPFLNSGVRCDLTFLNQTSSPLHSVMNKQERDVIKIMMFWKKYSAVIGKEIMFLHTRTVQSFHEIS